jgi:hypothetical protein
MAADAKNKAGRKKLPIINPITPALDIKPINTLLDEIVIIYTSLLLKKVRKADVGNTINLYLFIDNNTKYEFIIS